MRYSTLAVTILTVATGVVKAAPAHSLHARMNEGQVLVDAIEAGVKDTGADLSRTVDNIGQALKETTTTFEQLGADAEAGARNLGDGAGGSGFSLVENEVPAAIANGISSDAKEAVAQGRAVAESLNPERRAAVEQQIEKLPTETQQRLRRLNEMTEEEATAELRNWPDRAKADLIMMGDDVAEVIEIVDVVNKPLISKDTAVITFLAGLAAAAGVGIWEIENHM